MKPPPPVDALQRPLLEHYGTAPARAGFVRALFDGTAGSYDRVEAILALGTGPWYRGQALRRAGLQAGQRALDIGIGTGLVAERALHIIGDAGELVGLDPSVGMLGQARRRLGPTVGLVCGLAEALPFPDRSFDFLSMGYALRHIEDIGVAFREFYRVLRPGGRLCLLEITRPQRPWSRALLKAYMRGVVPRLARLVGAGPTTAQLWRYYWDTIEACVPPQQVVETLRTAGFAEARHHVDQKPLSVFAEFQARRT
ncbi:MAG: class I SAM-dependent methyltransferase [Betaproteobacteria bacterium]